MPKENREVKNTVFVDIFSKPENFLSLYNAINNTDLKIENTVIENKRISSSVFKGIQNDVSMLVNGKVIILMEHQSTINDNMPLRCLLYAARLYESLVPSKFRYKKELLKIPKPEFYVIYNGVQDYPAEKELCLSDAFFDTDENSQLELKVKVLNINSSKNLPQAKKCSILEQYTKFIENVRYFGNLEVEDCFRKAIQKSISENILVDYLESHAAEVISMLMVDYDYDTDIAVQREEAREHGYRDGQAEGMAKGLAEGRAEGKTEATIQIAKNLLLQGISLENVSKATGLSMEQINEL